MIPDCKIWWSETWNRQFVRNISLLAKVNLKRSASGAAAAMGSLGQKDKDKLEIAYSGLRKVNALEEKSVE